MYPRPVCSGWIGRWMVQLRRSMNDSRADGRRVIHSRRRVTCVRAACLQVRLDSHQYATDRPSDRLDLTAYMHAAHSHLFHPLVFSTGTRLSYAIHHATVPRKRQCHSVRLTKKRLHVQEYAESSCKSVSAYKNYLTVYVSVHKVDGNHGLLEFMQYTDNNGV